MKRFVAGQWFLIALAAVLAVGFAMPDRLQGLADAKQLRMGLVATVLFLMALPLETRIVWRVFRRPWAAFLAVGVNMGLLPVIAWLVSLGLSREMAIGLLVTAATPCTLASASVWTRRAGGNDAVAMFVTILTNVSCFVVTPMWLLATTGKSVDIPMGPMIARLGLLVVLPIVLAQLLRQIAPLGRWATDRKRTLSTLAQCGILTMVLIGAVRSANVLRTAGEASLGLADLALMLVAVLAVHLAALWLGCRLARLLRMANDDVPAVAFAGSQKTLMVGLDVAITYYGGLAILPMVAYHVGQLLVDTLIADRWRSAK